MIFFTLHQQHGRLYFLHIANRRQRVVQRLIVPRLSVEFKLGETLRIAAAVPVGPVGDRAIGLDCLEAIGLCGDPRGHEAAVRAAGGAHLRAVHVGARRHDVHGLHQVVVVFHAPTAARAVREVPSVATRAARVREQHEHALRREVLKLIEPAFAVRRVRAAMNVDHHRILLAWAVAVRLHEPAFDLQVADALVREAIGIAPHHVRVHVVVEARELTLARAVSGGHEQLRGLCHRGRRVRHHLGRGVVAGTAQLTTATDQFLGRRLTGEIGAKNRRAATDVGRELQMSGGEPGQRARLELPVAEEIPRHAAGHVHDINTRRLHARRAAHER